MNRVEERDLGWKRIQREIQAAKSASVRVGVLADAGTSDDGVDLVDIAVFNEFGTKRAPPRPFIRGAFDEKQRDLTRLKARLWNQVLAGRLDTRRALGLLGQTHEDQIKVFMTELRTPANEASTIAAKTRAGRKGDNPLIDTGRLRASIRWTHD